MAEGVGFVFVIGGDAHFLKLQDFILRVLRLFLGSILGRLGFLSQTNENELSASIEKVLGGKYKVEDRLMLKSKDNVLALNDFVIKGASASRTSRFYLSINDKFVCDYMADA